MSRDFISDIAFTPSVKAQQEQRGSRGGYQKMAERGDWQSTVGEDLKAFLLERNSFYLGTAAKDGQPYIQHRGGPRGFLKVIDENTLGFADFAGNRQYISIGNLAENAKAYIFLMDYENRRRVKVWGRMEAVEGDEALVEKLMVQGYRARPERAFLFKVEAWDTNCPQHIPVKLDVDIVEAEMNKLKARIKALELELADRKNRPKPLD